MRKNASIALLSVGHACVDIYQGAVAALVPYFVSERHYTLAAASGVVLAASFLSSVAQPLFGGITDRTNLPWLIPISTLLGGIGIALTGLSGSYTLILAFAAVSGIGVAAYHPEAARVARIASEGSHRAMAYFSTGGNIGFAVAPLTVAAAVGFGGVSWTPVMVIPAAVGAAITLPVLRGLRQRHPTGTQTALTAGSDDVASFVRLSIGVVFRSIAFVGLSAFIGLYARERMGGGTSVGTAALFVLYSGGIVGSIWGGSLAHRWDRVTVARGAYLLSAAALAGVVWIPGPAMYVFVVLTSIGLYVPFSLQVTLGQDYLPSRVGTASGITLGLTVSVGGLASPLIGKLAEVTSLQTALAPLVAMPLMSWILFRTLRDPEPARQDPMYVDDQRSFAPVHPGRDKDQPN